MKEMICKTYLMKTIQHRAYIKNYNSIIKQTEDLIQNMAKDGNGHFMKEDAWMAN